VKVKILSIFLGLFFILFFFNSVFAQERKNQVTIFGGLSYIFEYGSKADYMAMGNDFPVTPSHNTPTFGISYTRFFSKKIGLEVDFRYLLSSKLTLIDPYDNDEIKIDSSKHWVVTGNFIYQLSSGKFRPYLLVGAGIDSLADVKDQTVESKLGYIVTIEAPEKKIDFTANAGMGFQYFVSSNFGLRADIRYVLITSSPDKINSINSVIGAFFRF
jgi:outer membrane protein W